MNEFDCRGDYHSLQQELSSLLRRLYRLYLHAFYQHRIAFAEEEMTRHSYEKFHFFVMYTELITEKDLKPYLSIEEMTMSIYDYDSFVLWIKLFPVKRNEN